jgi:hypothetical protein
MTFIKAEQGLEHSVIYTDDAGQHFRYYGGTFAWRNHNPGNVWPGQISKKHGQIGVAFKFAVFPDYESGHLALLDVLKITYGNSSIYEMMMIFAPPKENNTAKYIKFLREATEVKDERKIKEFTDDQFDKLWKGIELIEGYKEGNIVQVYKVSRVRKDKKGVISDYYVDASEWIKQEHCIELIKQHKIELEICMSRLGHIYLRATPKSLFQRKLHDLIEKKPKEL